MSLDVMRTLIAANPTTPDAGLVRVRAADIVAACDEIPTDKLDKKAKDIRYGSANHISEWQSEEKKESCIVIVPILYARHLVKLAGG